MGSRWCSVAVAAAAVLGMLGSTACSGDEAGERDDALVVGSLALQDWGAEVDRSVRRCFGQALIDDLGLQAALEEADPDQPAAGLSAEELEIARAAYDECMPAVDFATALTGSMVDDPDTAPEELAELSRCVTERVEGRVGDAWVEATQASDLGGAVTGVVGDCPTENLVRRLLDADLTEDGRPPEVRACVLDAVTATLTLGEVVADDPVAGVRVEAAVADCTRDG